MKTRVLALSLFPLVALAAPLLVGRPDAIELAARLLPPGPGHWLGTDDLGRDVLARLVFGARVSVGTGALASLVSLLLGAALGSLAGFGDRWPARGALFLIDVFQAVPPLVLAAAGAAVLPPSFLVTALLVAAASWTDAARLVRTETLRVRRAAHVEAARAAGASRWRVLFVHVLPHTLGPVWATAPYVLGSAVLIEASLSFLGLGTPPPMASWGRALADARSTSTEAWWCVVPPALALFLLVLAARRLGEAIGGERLQSAAI